MSAWWILLDGSTWNDRMRENETNRISYTRVSSADIVRLYSIHRVSINLGRDRSFLIHRLIRFDAGRRRSFEEIGFHRLSSWLINTLNEGDVLHPLCNLLVLYFTSARFLFSRKIVILSHWFELHCIIDWLLSVRSLFWLNIINAIIFVHCNFISGFIFVDSSGKFISMIFLFINILLHSYIYSC